MRRGTGGTGPGPRSDPQGRVGGVWIPHRGPSPSSPPPRWAGPPTLRGLLHVAEPTQDWRPSALLHQGVSEHCRGGRCTQEGHREEEGVCPSQDGQSATQMAEDIWTGWLEWGWGDRGAGWWGEGRCLGGACEWEQAGPA